MENNKHFLGRNYRKPGSKPLQCFHCFLNGHSMGDCDEICFVCNNLPHRICRCNIATKFGSTSRYRKLHQSLLAERAQQLCHRQAPQSSSNRPTNHVTRFQQALPSTYNRPISSAKFYVDLTSMFIAYDRFINRMDYIGRLMIQQPIIPSFVKIVDQQVKAPFTPLKLWVPFNVDNNVQLFLLLATNSQQYEVRSNFACNNIYKGILKAKLEVFEDTNYLVLTLRSHLWTQNYCNSIIENGSIQEIYIRPYELVDFENTIRIKAICCLLSNGLIDAQSLQAKNAMPFNPYDFPTNPSIFKQNVLKSIIDGRTPSGPTNYLLPYDNFDDLWRNFQYEIPAINTLNNQQIEAIRKSVDFSQSILCIQGAAGTGKTETLAMIALLFAFLKSKILIVVASNEASDNIVKRILKVFPEAKDFLIRPVSSYYGWDQVAEEMQDVCTSGMSVNNFGSKQIIVTTMAIACHSQSLSQFKPDCICVEEASLVLLSDFIALLESYENRASKVIIAGDKHQLPAQRFFPTIPDVFKPANYQDPEEFVARQSNPLAHLNNNIQFLALKNCDENFVVLLNEIYRFSNLDISITKFVCSLMYPEVAKFHNNSQNVSIGHKISRYLSQNKVSSTTCARIIRGASAKKYSNVEEARKILEDYVRLSQMYEHLTIGILVFYKEQQLILLKMAMEKRMDLGTINIRTIDSQGSEFHIVLLSFGRSDGELGFLRNNSTKENGRIVTALTRHKIFLCIYINENYFGRVEKAHELVYGLCEFMDNENLII